MKKTLIVTVSLIFAFSAAFSQKDCPPGRELNTIKVPTELVISDEDDSGVFRVEGLENYKQVLFSIYDQNSVKLYEEENYNLTNNWRPIDLPTGEYFFFLEFKDKAPKNAKKNEISGKLLIENILDVDIDIEDDELFEDDDE